MPPSPAPFGKPAAGFDAPLDMLSSCHRRGEERCDTLQRLLPHLAAHGPDEQARDAALALLRYFDEAAVHHHADEERELFPALLEAVAGSDAVCLRELTESLRADHHALQAHWLALRPALEQIAAGRAATPNAQAAEALIAGYGAHIRREDAELLPLARRLLDAGALQQMGAAMRMRRGIAPGC
jgi:hemerythrin-like domain-containing protein